MTSTSPYGNRFGRRFKPFKPFKPFRLRFRSSRRGHAPLSSIDTSSIISEVEQTEAEVSPKTNAKIQVSKSVKSRKEAGGRAAALHQSLPPAFKVAHTKNEQTLLRLQLENLLREQAIQFVSLLYEENHPTPCRFDVCTTTATDIVLSQEALDFYVTRAIVFTDMESSNWHIIKQGAGNFVTPTESLEAFTRELRKDLDIHAAKRGVQRTGSAPGVDHSLVDVASRGDAAANPFESPST